MNFEKIAKLSGKSVDELVIEFVDFTEIVKRQHGGRLEGEELESRSETLFKQKYRTTIQSNGSNGSVSLNIHVTGISDTQDKIQWQRNKAIDIYKINPNKAIMEGRMNEYTIVDDKVIKKTFDQADQEVVEKVIEKLSPNAEEIEVGVYVAPVDNQKKGFGGKDNKNFGQELPLHKYSCYVHGFAEIDGSDDLRWTKLMLRGNNSVDHGVNVNQSYTVKAIDMSDKGGDEYNFIDTDEMNFIKNDWNPFDGEFIEEAISMNFIQGRIVELGDVDDYLKRVETLKDVRKFSDWNGAILVEADVSKIYLGKEGISDRLYVDDDSLRWGEDDVGSNVNVWVSKSNEINFGEYSRLLMTCYPSRGRPPKDSPDGTKGKMQLNAFGLFAFAKYRTEFEPEE